MRGEFCCDKEIKTSIVKQTRPSTVADPEFYNGATVEAPKTPRGVRCGEGVSPSPGGVWVGRCAPFPEKNEFLPDTGRFWCILGLLFTFKKA